jgi:hypothetical protein
MINMSEGWKPLEEMDDQEVARETLLILRAVADALNSLGGNMGNNSPMMNVLLRATGADKIRINANSQ